MSSSAKRSRKSKLVPRDIENESDDDKKIAELQNEVEKTLAKINTKSKETVQERNLQFNVNIEVEEYDECVKEVPNIKTFFYLDLKQALNESNRIVYRSKFIANQILDIELRNYCGKQIRNKALNFHDNLIHKAITRWRNWAHLGLDSSQSVGHGNREPPLCYKCYVCRKAWWHLKEFKDHIYGHKNINFRVSLEMTNYLECNIVAYIEKVHKYNIEINSNCWRCGNDSKYHEGPKTCAGCSKDLLSCTALIEHIRVCRLYQATLNVKTGKRRYCCHLCSAFYFKEEELLDHMMSRHSVRSDLPIASYWVTCKNCKEVVCSQDHICNDKQSWNYHCYSCHKRFPSIVLLNLHKHLTRMPVNCMICTKKIRRICMLPEHMIFHTTHYALALKCLLCPESVFLEPAMFSPHVNEHHKMVRSVPCDYVFLPIRVIDNAKKLTESTPKIVNAYSIDTKIRRLVIDIPKTGKTTSEYLQPCSSKQIDNEIQNISNISDIIDLTQTSVKVEKDLNDVVEKDLDDVVENDLDDVVENDLDVVEKDVDDVIEKDLHDVELIDTSVKVKEETEDIMEDNNEDSCHDNDISNDNGKEIECNVESNTENLLSHVKLEPAAVVVDRSYIDWIKTEDDINNTGDFNAVDTENIINNYTDNEENELSNTEMSVDMVSNVEAADNESDNHSEVEGVQTDSSKIINILNNTEVATTNTIINFASDLVNEIINDDVLDNKNNDSAVVKIEKDAPEIDIIAETSQAVHCLLNDYIEPESKNVLHDKVMVKQEPDEIIKINVDLSGICKQYPSVSEKDLVGVKEEKNDDSDKTNSNDKDKDWGLLSDVINYFNDAVADDEDEIFENDLVIIEPHQDSVVCIDDDDDNDNTDMDAAAVDGKVKRLYKCKCTFMGPHKQFREHQQECKFVQKRYMNMLVYTRTYTCTKCNTHHSSLWMYLKHFTAHGYLPLQCPQCHTLAASFTKLTHHVVCHLRGSFLSFRSINNKTGKYTSCYSCKICESKVPKERFFQHWEAHLHLKQSEEVQPDVKPDVKPLLSQDPAIRKIIHVFTNVDAMRSVIDDTRIRKCVACPRGFKRRNECVRHMMEHLLTDAFRNKTRCFGLRCQLCGQGFEKPDGFRMHVRTHTSLPIYKCETCNKTFSDSSNFSKHKKVHNIRILICDLCSKKFSAKICLERHLQEHSDPIQCDRCEKVFYSNSVFKKHYKMAHDKIRPKYNCFICQLKFDSLKLKWEHMWNVHKERKDLADCPICKASFRRYRDVKLHMQEEHQDIMCSDGIGLLEEIKRSLREHAIAHRGNERPTRSVKKRSV